ncbi:MAG: hypothetical protein FJ086_08670 [Deltaproteobacteria bacterium]|nr:hypothetical protein [Deltaproteobacteria bacterium]
MKIPAPGPRIPHRSLPPLALFACLAGACGPEAQPPAAFLRSEVAPWETGPAVGFGVSRWEADNPLGANVFIGYGGYGISLAETQAWVSELYATRLRALGVRTLFAVQGPADSGYNALEIGNSKIGAYLQQSVTADTGFILVAAHSSGSFVAGEFLQQLANGADPSGALAGRLVYFNLEGGQKYVTAPALQRLRNVYHATAWNPATGQVAWNHGTMQSLGNTWASKGGFLRYDASGSGCTNGACLHVTLVNTRPHSASSGSGVDYADFGGRPVHTWYLDEVRAAAGLGQCTTPFLTEGAVEAAYAQLGGCHSPLGMPTSNTAPTADGAGHYNLFEHGTLTVWADGGTTVSLEGQDAGVPGVGIPDAGVPVEDVAPPEDAGMPAPDAGLPPPVPAAGCVASGGLPLDALALLLALSQLAGGRARRAHITRPCGTAAPPRPSSRPR